MNEHYVRDSTVTPNGRTKHVALTQSRRSLNRTGACFHFCSKKLSAAPEVVLADVGSMSVGVNK